MIILACHLGLKTLLPDLQAVLINHADQWCTFAKEGDHPLLIPGNFILAEFGQFWISVGLNHTLTAGGGRFMRKWAGVEAAHAEFEPKINILVKEKIEDLFEIKLTATDKYQSQIELHTCDELPLIGPWYNESRILLASGFMGSGLSLGFAAGRGLADMVALGSSKTVPDTFHPKRLRSLPEVP
jgi:glycine/D-amino acid oxidase-like deaminating enzyme